jgi:hypothetical protein
MRHITVGLLTFLLSLMVYSWIGFLWVLYNGLFASGTGQPLVTASNIQTVVFVSVLGALVTAFIAYMMERGLRITA